MEPAPELAPEPELNSAPAPEPEPEPGAAKFKSRSPEPEPEPKIADVQHWFCVQFLLGKGKWWWGRLRGPLGKMEL